VVAGITVPEGFTPDSGTRYLATVFAVTDASNRPIEGLSPFGTDTTVIGTDAATYPAVENLPRGSTGQRL
jgi:hypothetical protein